MHQTTELIFEGSKFEKMSATINFANREIVCHQSTEGLVFEKTFQYDINMISRPEIVFRLIDACFWNIFDDEKKWNVRDGVVLVSDIEKRFVEQNLYSLLKNKVLLDLKTEVEWGPKIVPHNPLYEIMIQTSIRESHTDIFDKRELRKFLRQNLELFRSEAPKAIGIARNLKLDLKEDSDGWTFFFNADQNERLELFREIFEPISKYESCTIEKCIEKFVVDPMGNSTIEAQNRFLRLYLQTALEDALKHISLSIGEIRLAKVIQKFLLAKLEGA